MTQKFVFRNSCRVHVCDVNGGKKPLAIHHRQSPFEFKSNYSKVTSDKILSSLITCV